MPHIGVRRIVFAPMDGPSVGMVEGGVGVYQIVKPYAELSISGNGGPMLGPVDIQDSHLM